MGTRASFSSFRKEGAYRHFREEAGFTDAPNMEICAGETVAWMGCEEEWVDGFVGFVGFYGSRIRYYRMGATAPCTAILAQKERAVDVDELMRFCNQSLSITILSMDSKASVAPTIIENHQV